MSLLTARGLRVLCVVFVLSVSVIISRTAYSDTADCLLEAESISGMRLRPTTPGVFPGSTSGASQPGASNSSDDRGRIYAEVYADCLRRQAAAQSQRPSEPSASPPTAGGKER